MQHVSYWEHTSYFAKQDVVIIGAGFTGLWTALELKTKYPNYKITILDAGILPTGASTKNAGFACFGSPTELLADAALYGADAMWALVYKRYHGIRKIHNTFSYSSIDYINSGGYECLLDAEYNTVLQKLDWLNAGLKHITGISDVYSIATPQLKTLGIQHMHGLVSNKLEGMLHPAKLLQQLHYKVSGMGVSILHNATLLSYAQHSNGIALHTTTIPTLHAGKLIICTNGYAKALLPLEHIQATRGQVCITDAIPNLQLKGCFHYNEGYYYFRNVGNRILMGGARNIDFDTENTEALYTTEIIQTELKSFIQKHLLPNTPYTIAHSWSGTMGFGVHKSPIVKVIAPNVIAAVRLCGMGVALAPMLATDVLELL